MINTNTLSKEKIEEDIAAINYYYNRHNFILKCQEEMSNYYSKINELNKQIKKAESELKIELNGEYCDVFDFMTKGGSYTTNIVNKKVREGRLEKLKEYLYESSERRALDRYLKDIGGKFYDKECINIDELLGIDYDVEEELGE